MGNKRPTFRLYILGRLDDYIKQSMRLGVEVGSEKSERRDNYNQQLITFAEFEQSRAVERITLTQVLVDRLSSHIRNLHEFIEAGSPAFESSALETLGGQLFELIIKEKVRRLFDRATGYSKKLLPFEIFVEDPAITGWPWEYLYDTQENKFLSQEFHPISRGIFTLYFEPPLEPIRGKVRILLVIGVLPGDPETTPEEEIKWMQDVFETNLATDMIELKIMQAIGPEELDKELEKNSYDILHFFGHARFDPATDEGYLKFDRAGSGPYNFKANDFAKLLANKSIRLVFLNACETGKTSRNEDPARSSIAAALLARGVPAVIATQFSIPDVSAHHLSSMIYNGLLTGKPLVEALRDGRRAMCYAPRGKYFDWGIPVLYTTDPDLVIFPKPGGQRSKAWVAAYEKATSSENIIKALGTPSTPHSPSLTVERTINRDNKEKANRSVALIDFDAKVGFLPDLVEKANLAQHYYSFQVAYLPIPSGAIRTDLSDEGSQTAYPQLYLPVLEDYLGTLPEDLNVNKVCCLTRCRIAGVLSSGPFQDYRAAALHSTKNVFAMSTYKLREYAKQASTSYAKATLYICLAMVVATDVGIRMHPETAGCLFDDCENRDDIVVGLKRMKFDHFPCREKIRDEKQLQAIEALLDLQIEVSGPGE